MQSAAITTQQRGQRYTERMAGVSENILPHLEQIETWRHPRQRTKHWAVRSRGTTQLRVGTTTTWKLPG